MNLLISDSHIVAASDSEFVENVDAIFASGAVYHKAIGNYQVVTADIPDGHAWQDCEYVNGGVSLKSDTMPTLAQYQAAVQAVLDSNAQRLGYDGILSAASYAGDQNSTFGSQGAAFKSWRSAVWAKCYAALAQVQAGTMPQPTTQALVAMLPGCPI